MPAVAELGALDFREAARTSRSPLEMEEAGYFLVLCCRENREVYEPEFSRVGLQAVFATSVEEVLRYGFMLPPLAIVIDVYTATRIGVEKVSGLFNLGVAWPVMRANITADQDVRIMCLEPARSESLGSAIADIAGGDADWKHPRFFRKSMRIDLRTRARIKTSSETTWRQANLLSMSVGGAYLVLMDAIPAKGAAVDLEVLDLTEEPLQVSGKIAWRRTWDDGPDLPGLGIEFDPTTVTSELRTAVAQTIAPTIRTGTRRPARDVGQAADSIFSTIETREAAREFNW